MNLIHNDISRCTGRFGLGPDDPICPRRQQCARYRQIEIDLARFPEGYPVFVSTWLCRGGDDYLIPLDAP